MRRAPAGERAVSALGVALALAVVGWLLAPAHSPGRKTVAVNGASSGSASQFSSQAGGSSPTSGPPGPGISGVAGSTGAAGAGAPSPVTASATGGSGSTGTGPAAVSGPSKAVGAGGGAGGCTSPPPGAAGTPGVTPTQIKIAITLTDILGPAGNSTFGLPSSSQQQTYYQDVVNALNSSGGVACRTLVPEFFTVNAADAADQQQKCLDIVQSGVFAEIDFTAYSTVGGDCFAQHHLPFFIDYFLPAVQTHDFYPYLFGLNTYDSLYRNTVFALRQRGFFDPTHGFKKLGYVYRDCFPQVISETMGWLQQAGVPKSDIVPYDVGCPAAFATPGDLEQAVLKFEQNGVTNVTTTYFLGDFANFTSIAQQQGFHPKYGIGDDGTVNVSYGSQHPDYANIAGAVAITASRYGEERTPGMTPTPGTARCNAIYQHDGQAPTYQQLIGAGGDICDELWMFQAAVDHAATLSQDQLAAGLTAAKSVDFSYPQGPNDFAGPGVTTGGQYWRTDEFFTSCDCWRVTQPAFQPSL